MAESSNLRKKLTRGELVGLLYRLGHGAASGVLTIAPRDHRKPERVRARSIVDDDAQVDSSTCMFVLRRGNIVITDGEAARKTALARLARLVAIDEVVAIFEGGVAAYPPGATNQISLAGWARQHLEQQLDGTLADILVRELAGVRLGLRTELSPEPADDADRRMLAAMSQPRRLDQIWPLARTPRFRLLAFIHFLRSVDALDGVGVVAERSAPHHVINARREAACRMLGVEADADTESVKRAYRKLARSLHPDLQPTVDDLRRRTLERRFAEVTAAYETLL